MKVDSKINNNAAQAQGTNSAKSQNTKKSAESVLAGLGGQTNLEKSKGLKQDSARIELSQKAQDMKKAKEIAKNAPDVDMEKVKKFQALIDSGSYKVDSQKIADKMVDDNLMTAAMSEDR